MKSVSGKAKINLPVTSRLGARNKQVIEIAGGGPEVSMKSVSGILKVGSPNYVKPETESAQTEVEFDTPIGEATTPESGNPTVQLAKSSKTQMQILREIEKGEISVDEALKQMNL
jgi:hypothetical protein